MHTFRDEAEQLSGVVIVMGVCGSGKSSLGRFIAKQYEPNSKFIEGDDHHPPENVIKMSQGRNLHQEQSLQIAYRIELCLDLLKLTFP